jgi:hypothetical protein
MGDLRIQGQKHRSQAALSDELHVLAQTAYPEVAAGSRVRIVEMASHLERFKVNVQFRPSTTNAEYELISSPGLSARKLAALARGFARSSRGVRRTDAGLTLVHRLRSLVTGPCDRAPLDIYDFDDALYIGSESASHLRPGTLKHEATRCVRYMRHARLVFAGNRVLAEAASQYAARVEVVPSCVDPELQDQRAHREVETITLGWTGSSTTSPYLNPVIEVIGTLVASGCQIRLLLMGAARSLQAPWIEHRVWSVAAERQMLTEVDIGLMPLPNTPWARGKCGYKLLRYFSAGLPAIASPVGINLGLLADGRGLCPTSANQWSQSIQELARDAAARRQMGARGRGFVEREFSYQVWAPRVASLLQDLAAT